jgi:hypothetical protein
MDNFDLKKYLVENKVTTNSQMVNKETGPEEYLINSAASSFPQLIKKYGLEAVKTAFDVIYENTFGYAYENQASAIEAHEYAEKEILQRVKDFKKHPADLENLITDLLPYREDTAG